MPAPSGNHMHGDAGIEQQGFVSTAKIVESKVSEPERLSPSLEVEAELPRLAQFCERELFATRRRAGEHQRAFGKFNQP